MKLGCYKWLCGILFALSVSSVCGQEFKEPAPEEIAKIRTTMPSAPRVFPQQWRKVLVFSRSWGYKHSAIPYGKVAFQIMGEKTRAFDAIVSDDLDYFESENIVQFDAVIFNNTNNEIFLPENFDSLSAEEKARAEQRDQRLKQSLVDFLQSGKGLAVFHAGVASFRKWPEFGNIIGARFDNHPWVAGSTVTLKVDEPDHPLAAAFEIPVFPVTDEIYQLTGDYSRDTVRVIVSIDIEKTDMTVDGIHRTDGDFAMTYIKTYGKGRIYYNALGHQHELFWNPVLLQHWLDGIQYVLGDLEADATPGDKVK
ncbi:MAG: ThuA domain-containing protein [Sedimentisphaerales bacterium]|nr:ThuA domain-containing protein [Sedimentisphaerales bacterium]